MAKKTEKNQPKADRPLAEKKDTEKSPSSAKATEGKQEEKKSESAPKAEPKAEVKSEESKDEIKLTGDAKKIAEMVEKMSVLELNTLVKALEKKFGVSAAVPTAVAPGAAAANNGAAEPAEEKSEYDVILAEAGGNKIQVIKTVREINQNLGLKDAKELVESAPKPVLEGAKKEDAEAAKAKLEGAGARVELK